MKKLKRSKIYLSYLALAYLLVSCGYKAASSKDENTNFSIQVPKIKGDNDGTMVSMLIKSLSQSPHFTYVANQGRYILDVEVTSERDDTIGFQYDHTRDGKLIDRLVPSEARREVVAKVTVFDTTTHENIGTPFEVSVEVDYDFSNFDTYRDLSFSKQDGSVDSSLSFSLGQLNTKTDAKLDATETLYQKLAGKIILGLSALIAEH